MRRIMLRPAWVLGLVLLVLLAMTGVAFGLWAKTLTIEGTVHTGELNAEYSVLEVDETYDFNGGTVGNGQSDLMEFEGKDVALCDVELIDSGQFPDLDNPGYQGMKVTIYNAYPSFNCFVLFGVTNTGTIPLKIHLTEYSLDGVDWNTSGFNTAEIHLNGWPNITYGDDTQLHTGESVYKSMHFHLNQGAEMATTYTFYLRNFVHQWNEEGSP